MKNKKTLNKTSLAKQLASSGCHPLSKAGAVRIIETLVDLIALHFIEGGDNVSLRGFGTFIQRRRKGFITTMPEGKLVGRGSSAGRIKVPSVKTIGFRPGETLKKRINS